MMLKHLIRSPVELPGFSHTFGAGVFLAWTEKDELKAVDQDDKCWNGRLDFQDGIEAATEPSASLVFAVRGAGIYLAKSGY